MTGSDGRPARPPIPPVPPAVGSCDAGPPGRAGLAVGAGPMRGGIGAIADGVGSGAPVPATASARTGLAIASAENVFGSVRAGSRQPSTPHDAARPSHIAVGRLLMRPPGWQRPG